MAIWEFGLETVPFTAVLSGKKTIEGRLNKGKFAEFAVGDVIKIRQDYRDEHDIIRDGKPDAARVEILAIREYPDFRAMIQMEGIERVSSRTQTIQEASDGYTEYYSVEDQGKYGVLAIEVRVLS